MATIERRSWPINWSVVAPILLLNQLQFCFQKRHDRATITFTFASKIGRDRFNFASKRGEILLESCIVPRGFDSAMEDPRSRLNRAAIAVRSDRDRGSIGPQSWSSSANPPSRPIEL